MFFGALALATGASFVGCKDYDDDIDAVNARVDGLEKSLSELQKEVGGCVKSVVYNPTTGVLTVTGGNNESFTLPMPKDVPEYTLDVKTEGNVVTITLMQDGKAVGKVGTITLPKVETPDIPESFDPSKLTVKDGYIYYDGTKTEAALPAASACSCSIMAITNESGDIIGYTISAPDKTTGEMTSATFSIIDALPLKGLVFRPECYVSGIPATNVYSIDYDRWVLADPKAEVGETGEVYKEDDSEKYEGSEILPQVWAYYHMNPSSVSMDQIETLAFTSDDKVNYTRASVIVPTADKAKSLVAEVDGQRLLKVAMTLDRDKMPEKLIPVFALQAQAKVSEEKTIVTSGYATVHKSELTDFVLKTTKVKTPAEGETEAVYEDVVLYGQALARVGGENTTYEGKAEEAIKAAADYTVNYKATFDLTNVIKVYYKEGSEEVLLTEEKLNDFGLKVVYEASNYLGGKANEDKTPQNTFINTTEAAKGIVDPEFEGKESDNTIGRKPLIRVSLINTANNEVLTVGWVKTEIERGDVKPIEITAFDKGTYYYGCEDFTGKLDYLDMNKVYDQVKMSKEEFHKAYTYNESASMDKDVCNGVVAETTTTPVTATNLFEWTVTPAEAKTIIDDDKKANEVKAIIVYKSNDGTRADVVITMTAKIAVASGTIKNDCKRESYWFENYTYVKADVSEPKATAVTYADFKINLFNMFKDNKVVVSDVDVKNFTSFEDPIIKFVFSEKNADKTVKIGKVIYTFQVVGGTKLQACTDYDAEKKTGSFSDVATIDENGVLTYAETDIAKALLNKSAYNEDPFTAKVEIVASAKDCPATLLPLTGNTFDVKFLRPINIVALSNATLQDAKENAKIDLNKMFKLTDWRGKDFLAKDPNYYTYYGVTVKNVIVDVDQITTNMDGGEAKPVDPELLSLSYIESTDITKSLGTITYNNNKQAVSKEFKLFIPVTVKYTFGEQSTVVELTITPTHP